MSFCHVDTDKFIAVVHGMEKKVIKGNSLTVVPELPFGGLSQFGAAYLNKFEASVCPSELLESVTIIDSPGVLSGEKQRIARSYVFADVVRWFAERSDLILLLFDAHKLDISDEFREVIEALKPHDDKVRCVLNKADQIKKEQFVRVYGSLLWSMGKIFRTPEVCRVYCGSYWSQPLVNSDYKDMFEKDERLLVEELKNLPSSAAARKINDMVKRIRLVKVSYVDRSSRSLQLLKVHCLHTSSHPPTPFQPDRLPRRRRRHLLGSRLYPCLSQGSDAVLFRGREEAAAAPEQPRGCLR